MEEKICLDCGKAITVGRSDKKFCDDSCRTNYNNRQKERPVVADVPDYILEINQVLQENHRILSECLGTKDNTKIRTRDLQGRRFSFKFFTSQRVNDGNQEVYNFCYNLGYKMTRDEQWVVIVRNDKEAQLSGAVYRLQVTENDGLC